MSKPSDMIAAPPSCPRGKKGLIRVTLPIPGET
jgi:hypothetical protein